MDDDFFADLLGSTGIKPASKPTPTTPPSPSLTSVRTDSSSNTRPNDAKQDASTQGEPEPLVSENKNGAMGGVSKEELEQLVKTSVTSAIDATFGKFVKSLRTVLEDMGKRIDNTGSACEQLKQQFEQLRDVYDSQSENIHTRFSQVDLAIRDVERGVQSLRDKQELAEAQAMLAKMSHDQADAKQKAAAAPEAPPSPTPAAAPAPAAVSAPPVAAPAPAPQVQPAAAPQAPPQAQALPQAPPQQAYAAPAAPAPLPHPSQMPPPPQQRPAAAGPEHAPPQQQYGASAPAAQFNQYSQQPPSSSAPEAYGSAPPAAPPQGQGPPPGPYGPPPGQYQQPPPMAPPMQGPPGMPQGPPHMQGPPPPGPMPPPPHMPMGPGPQQGPPPVNYPPPMGAYPAPPGGMYPQAPPAFRPPGPGGPMGPPPPMAGPGGPRGQAQTQTRTVPLEQIITDIAHMGFERHQVMAVVNQLQQAGQSVDLNIILDRLTNGRY